MISTRRPIVDIIFEVKRRRVTVEDDIDDRPARRQRQTEIAVNDFVGPIEILHIDRLIEADLVLQDPVLFRAYARALVGIDAEHDEHRISGDDADEKKYRQANKNEDRNELQHAANDITCKHDGARLFIDPGPVLFRAYARALVGID